MQTTGRWRWIVAIGACLIANVGATAAEYFVGAHGWHTSIVVARADIPRGAWPPGVVERDFAGCRWLEVGWGDRKFYRNPHPGVSDAADAALSPGPSALHIAGFAPPLERAQNWSALVRVACSRAELDRLCRAIGATFEIDAHGRPQRLGRGLYGRRSQFYAARGLYWFGHTCDTFTAQMLRAAGLPYTHRPAAAATAGNVIAEARRLVATPQHALVVCPSCRIVCAR